MDIYAPIPIPLPSRPPQGGWCSTLPRLLLQYVELSGWLRGNQ